MDGAREDFLPGAAFAEQQDCSIARRSLLRRVNRLAHPFTSTKHQVVTFIGLFSQEINLALESYSLQSFAHDNIKMVRVDRLGDKVIGSLFHRFYRCFDRAMRGDDYGWNFETVLPERAQHVHATHPGHL